MEENLRNAEKYVVRNENVESSGFLHFRDWKGNSGHPAWMKNVMIPKTTQALARKEKALERIAAKSREMKSQKRRKKKA